VTSTDHNPDTHRFPSTHPAGGWQHDTRKRETRPRDRAAAETPTVAVFQRPPYGHNTVAVRCVAHRPLSAEGLRS
jgi:hypothetical protein